MFTYFMCMDLLPALCVCVYVCVSVPAEASRRHQIPPGLKLQMVVNCLVGTGNLTPDPLEEQPVYLMTDPSLRP